MASRGRRSVDPQEPGVAELAAALAVLARLDGGQVLADTAVRTAYDALYASVQRRDGETCLRRLAEVLVGRGVVLGPREYEGSGTCAGPRTGAARAGPAAGCGC
jgi:hypothetical protein